MNGTTALLLVDVQQDFLSASPLYPNSQALCSAISELLRHARASNWPVIHIQTVASPDGSDWMPHWRRAGAAPCVAGTPGAAAPDELAARPGEPTIIKRHFSGFRSGELAACLDHLNIERVILAGVHTHACIRETAADAFAEGLTVIIATEAVGSYDPDHANFTLRWLDGRVASCLTNNQICQLAAPTFLQPRETWIHRDPCNWNQQLDEVALCRPGEVAGLAEKLAERQGALGAMSLGRRAELLRKWYGILEERQQTWVELLVRDVAKPLCDARAEVTYGLALVQHVIETLADEERIDKHIVRYRPHGVVGLITPWNNPFAIPVGKLAPALSMGNAALWKPALPATHLSRAIVDSLVDAELDTWVGLVTGDSETGRAVATSRSVDAVSFTGSVAAGRALSGTCGAQLKSIQAELGGNNAAIILGGCDIAAVAQELAQAMFSFSGQRCTAIRRLIVQQSILPAFREMLIAAIEALPIGRPCEESTCIGPVISKLRQQHLVSAISAARADGASIQTGGFIPLGFDIDGCWLAPTVIENAAITSSVFQDELFGPVVVLNGVHDLDAAIELHNSVEHGLLGTIYTPDVKAQRHFLNQAKAGILLINQARPNFSPAGPFSGWKASGFGPPEHGKWNREAFARVQALYG